MNELKPIKTFRDGAVGASIWLRSTQAGVFYDVTFSRSYTNDATGNPGYTSSFSERHMLSLRKVAKQAESWILQQKHGGEIVANEAAEGGRPFWLPRSSPAWQRIVRSRAGNAERTGRFFELGSLPNFVRLTIEKPGQSGPAFPVFNQICYILGHERSFRKRASARAYPRREWPSPLLGWSPRSVWRST
jgi:hypothetical protein